MKVHSYADPVIGAIRMTLEGRSDELESLMQVSGGDMTKLDFKIAVFNWAWFNHRSLIVHEWAHIFQVATYPYLFLRAARAGREMVGPGIFLENNPSIHMLPLAMTMDERWSASRWLSTFPVRLQFNSGSLEFHPAQSGYTRRGVVSERDLIEEDATVFQYRAEIGSPGNGAAYRNWLREKPSYSRLFSILSHHFGDDAALALIPILARVAFQTSRPLECLMHLIALLKSDQALVPTKPDDDFPEEVFSLVAQKEFGAIPDASLTMMRPEIDDARGFIPCEKLGMLIEKFPQLTVAPMAQRSVSAGKSGEPFLLEVLRKPWEFFDRRRQDVTPALVPYRPPVMTILPIHSEYKHGWTVVIFSPELDKTPMPDQFGATYLDLAKQVLRIRDVWKAILNGARGHNPRCPHADCHIHKTGLCHGWYPVPKAYRDCGFDEFFRVTTKHQVSKDGNRLEPSANTQEVQ